MIVARYKPSNTMRKDAIASLSQLPLVDDMLRPARKRFLKPGMSQTDDAEINAIEPNAHYVVDGVVYDCLNDGCCICIVHCSSDEPHLTIPSALGGLPVTAIAPHAFSTCYTLEQVDLPDCMVEIGGYAFMNTALTSFEAPASLRMIGSNAFYKCTRLEHVTLNEGLVLLGNNAFRDSALASLVIPLSVELIGYDAFKHTSLVACGENQTLVIDGAHPHYRLIAGALYRLMESDDAPEYELIQVLDSDIVTYVGPPGLVSVADRAFAGLKSLEHVILPEGVVSIGELAFKGSVNLTSVELPDSLRTIGRHAFWDTSLQTLCIPASLESAGIAAFYTGGSIANNFERTIRHVEITPGNERFFLEGSILCWRQDADHNIALLYTGNDERIVIPRHLTGIGPYAFLKARSVRHLVIHDEIDYIDVGGFDFGRAVDDVEYLVYAGTDHPVERYRIAYPPGQAGWLAARQTFGRGRFELAYAYAAADNAILITQDTFNRSKAMLDRMANPIMLDKHMRDAYEEKLGRTFISTVVAFGRNGYPQGIDLLLDFGLLNEHTIEPAIAAASDAGEVAVLSRLVEIKRTTFEAPLFDFDL